MGGTAMIKKKFGERVRELRTQKNMSQEKFALHIEMDRTYLASVESGNRNISLENIGKIAKGFGITIEELFKGM
jgi:transcriptional regulator with XRE-family HTH domain